MTPGPPKVSSLLDRPLDILLVGNLDGIPTPTFTIWDPNGHRVEQSSQYNFSHFNRDLHLNIRQVMPRDAGTWTCTFRVEDTNVTVADKVIPNLLVGEETIHISLFVFRGRAKRFLCGSLTQIENRYSIKRKGSSWITIYQH